MTNNQTGGEAAPLTDEQWEGDQMDAFNEWALNTASKDTHIFSAMFGWMASARHQLAIDQPVQAAPTIQGSIIPTSTRNEVGIDGVERTFTTYKLCTCSGPTPVLTDERIASIVASEHGYSVMNSVEATFGYKVARATEKVVLAATPPPNADLKPSAQPSDTPDKYFLSAEDFQMAEFSLKMLVGNTWPTSDTRWAVIETWLTRISQIGRPQ